MNKNNVFVTGLPNLFSQLQKHATDDYLLAILQTDSTILTKISAPQTTLPSSITGLNSKEILNTVLGNYDSTKVADILNVTNPTNYPQELKDLIDKIENS